MKLKFRRPSPAMAVACLALFVASTGTGIAAKHYVITSTKQIKPSVLTKLKGAKGPRGAQGAKGDTGAAGATGTTGAAGAAGATHVVKRYAYGPETSGISNAQASCNPGEVATGGGTDYYTFTGGAVEPDRV